MTLPDNDIREQTIESRKADLKLYCETVFGDTRGHAHIGIGLGPHLNDEGSYTFKRMVPSHFAWPGEADQMYNEIIRESDTHDVYLCPYLMEGSDRAKGAAVERRLVHSDYDGQADVEKIHAADGFAISSGTPGHAQVLVPITDAVTVPQHETLCRGLSRHLGDKADSKIADNDFLRPPGTKSHKPVLRGLEPNPVEWLVLPDGRRVDTGTLARMLKVEIGTPGAINGTFTGTTYSGSGEMSAPPGGLTYYTKVSDAVANVTGDRSADIARIVGACIDSNLELPHARWCVNLRPDLVKKLAEQGRAQDDVLRCYIKITGDRARARRDRPGNNFFDPNTDSGIEPDIEPARPFGDVRHLEADFWERQSLNIIHTAAKARLVSPWAVLGHLAIYALHFVPPAWTLPPIIGGPGSLNLFVALCSKSGGGKNTSADVADQLIGRRVHSCNFGSGEGTVKAYIIKTGCEEPDRQRPAVHFNVAEVDMLGALGNRNGSTLMATVREAFSGGQLGFAYATDGKDKHLAKHSYRLTMTIGVQPKRAATLLDDADGGTPQRFLWFPAKDPHAQEMNSPAWDGKPLNLTDTVVQFELNRQRLLEVPEETAATIRSEHVRAQREERDALDGHALFCREKFAYALAILDNRVDMNSEDWRLSGIAAEVSTFIRKQVMDEMHNGEREQAEKRGVLHGVTRAAADSEKRSVEDEAVAAALKKVLEILAVGPKKRRDLHGKLTKKLRANLAEALNLGIDLGQIRLNEDGTTYERTVK